MDFLKRINGIKRFILPFESIWQNEVLWTYPYHETVYPREWIDELESLPLEEIYKIDGRKNYQSLQTETLRDFLAERESIKQVEKYIPSYQEEGQRQLGRQDFLGVKPKKAHELTYVTKQLYDLDQKLGFSSVVDLGGGKGLLAQTICNYCKIPVISVDQDPELQERGRSRNQKYRQEGAPLVDFRLHKIGKEWRHLQEFFNDDKGVLGLGLHTCGDLAKYHLQLSSHFKVKALLNFACCYHKIQDHKVWNCSTNPHPLQLSPSALTLATRAHGPDSEKNFYHKMRVKAYRYTFHLLLREQFDHLSFESLGDSPRSLYYQDFADYAQEQLQRLGFSPDVRSKIELNDFYQEDKRKKMVNRMTLCGVIRALFGRPLELLILCDRALFMQENGYEVQLLEYFDEEISPRNIGLLATQVSSSGISPS